jgi:hypothetical protein
MGFTACASVALGVTANTSIANFNTLHDIASNHIGSHRTMFCFFDKR